MWFGKSVLKMKILSYKFIVVKHQAEVHLSGWLTYSDGEMGNLWCYSSTFWYFFMTGFIFVIFQVNHEESWVDIQEQFGIPKSCTNADYALKQIYIRYGVTLMPEAGSINNVLKCFFYYNWSVTTARFVCDRYVRLSTDRPYHLSLVIEGQQIWWPLNHKMLNKILFINQWHIVW